MDRRLPLAMVIVMLIGGACASKKKQDTLPNDPGRRTGGGDGEKKSTSDQAAGDTGDQASAGGGWQDGVFEPIRFEYDLATLSDGAREELVAISKYMEQNPGVTLTITGHADERNTAEYNIALGHERAKAARDYLIRLGVEAKRVKTVSYGEERPAVEGNDETAWSQNRRDEFELSGKTTAR